jgi:hypothetical protein
VFIDLLQWDNTIAIGTTITGIMTIIAYIRVYIIRRHFSRRNENEISLRK